MCILCVYVFVVSNLRKVLGSLMLPNCARAFTSVEKLMKELEGELLALCEQYAKETA